MVAGNERKLRRASPLPAAAAVTQSVGKCVCVCVCIVGVATCLPLVCAFVCLPKLVVVLAFFVFSFTAAIISHNFKLEIPCECSEKKLLEQRSGSSGSVTGKKARTRIITILIRVGQSV